MWTHLFFSDDTRTETIKDEEIILKFLAPLWTNNANTFTFKIEGHNPFKE